MHAIGSIIVWRGDEYIVTGLPYQLHGAEWQDAAGHGKVVTIRTPRSKAIDEAQRRATYLDMQAGFSRLAKTAR